MNNRIKCTGIAFLVLIYLLAGCGEIEEPVYPSLVNLLSGSAGYEGDGQVLGLSNGLYLVRHEKEQTHQEKNPAGELLIRHEEDWYALDAGGSIARISSSTSDIPQQVNTTALNSDPDNVIKGLTNGEKYNVYVYGELANGQRIGRRTGDLKMNNYNAVVNLKKMNLGHEIQIWETSEDSAHYSGGLNNNNHLVVLVNTPLHWTELSQTIVNGSAENAVIRLSGLYYDVEIKKRYARDWVTVAPIEKDGQQYFILTGSPYFKGSIKIVNKEG